MGIPREKDLLYYYKRNHLKMLKTNWHYRPNFRLVKIKLPDMQWSALQNNTDNRANFWKWTMKWMVSPKHFSPCSVPFNCGGEKKEKKKRMNKPQTKKLKHRTGRPTSAKQCITHLNWAPEQNSLRAESCVYPCINNFYQMMRLHGGCHWNI